MAGEGDIFQGIGSGAAAGSTFGPWGTAIGAGVGLAGGIFSWLGKRKQADALEAENREALRRRILQDQQVLGQATAAGAASGIEFDSTGLQTYLTSMRDEMKRQQEWQRRAGATNVSNMQYGANVGLFTDLGQTFSLFAKQNNYWKGP